MTESARQAIAVLGCHRSGTSVVTRSLLALGAVVGDDLLPPVEGNNDTGFWEDRELHLVVQDIQRRSGSDWDELSFGLDTHHQYVTDAAVQKIIDLLDSKASPNYPYAFKNPRVALLMSAMTKAMETLAIEPGYVVVVRDPLSVAKSLEQRDGLPLEHGVLLWLKYTIASVAAIAKQNAVFVQYAAMLTEPERELARIEQTLQMRNLGLRPSEVEVLREEFIDLDLRHHSFDFDELAASEFISDDVLEAYKDLVAAAQADPADGYTLSTRLWKRLARNFDEQVGAWRLIDQSRRTAKQATAEAAKSEKELAQARRSHVEEVQALEASGQRLETEAERVTNALEAADGCLRSITTAFETSQERERKLDDSLSNRSRELADVTEAREKLAVRLEEQQQEVDAKIQAQVEAHEGLVAQLLVERDEARAKLAQRIAEEPDVRAFEQERDRLELATAQLIAERDDARSKLAQHAAASSADVERVRELQADLDRLHADLGARHADLDALHADLAAVHSSTSWQVSKPVRLVGEIMKRGRRRD